MSRARELARLGNANAISIDTSNNVGLGTTSSIQYKLDVVGDANFTGVITATAIHNADGVVGGAATDNINSNNIKVSGITTLGTTSTIVGSAVTFTASGGTIVGVLTATSFEGDGSSLTGVAATDYIVSNSLKVLGISTFSGEVTAAGGVDVTGGLKVGAASTLVGAVAVTNTTASTSSATGAVVITGGVGIGGSLHVGENVSVGGTLTYEDVTNIDVIGIITARAGVLVNGGRGIDIAAGGLEVTGITTIGTGLSLTDDIKARFGASGDLSIYHNGSNSYMKDSGTGNLILVASQTQIINAAESELCARFEDGGSVELYEAGNKKLETSSTGVTVTGTLAATAVTGNGSGLTNLPSAGLGTAASTAAGIVSTLALSSAQDHKVTVSGVSTFTCNGGSEGESHTLRITNSGITTIGFSTYFLFPSGSTPAIPTADGTVSLISFTVHRVGTPGIATQLLAGASLNFS